MWSDDVAGRVDVPVPHPYSLDAVFLDADRFVEYLKEKDVDADVWKLDIEYEDKSSQTIQLQPRYKYAKIFYYIYLEPRKYAHGRHYYDNLPANTADIHGRPYVHVYACNTNKEARLEAEVWLYQCQLDIWGKSVDNHCRVYFREINSTGNWLVAYRKNTIKLV